VLWPLLVSLATITEAAAAATAQYRTQTCCLRNAPATGLMRDGPVVPALYPNWIESQHVLAPARQSKSGESATQERERRWLGHRIGEVADIIHSDDVIIHINGNTGDCLASVGEPNEGGSSIETGVGNVDRLARAIAEGDRFTGVLHTA